MKPEYLDDISRHYEGSCRAPGGSGRGPRRAAGRVARPAVGSRSLACFSLDLRAALAVAVLAMSAAGCSRKEPAPGEGASAAALNASPLITNFGVYAQNSATLRDRTLLTGGDVGVHVAGTGPFLVTGYELALVAGVQVDTTHNTIANRVLLQGAKVGDVQANTLTVQNGGTYAKKYAFPTGMPALPTLAPVFAGTAALTVNPSSTYVASPGRFGAVTLGTKSILRLAGGVYHLASLQLDDDARIEALAPVQVRVAGRVSGRLSTLARVWLGPATGVTLGAADLRIEVSGRNGTGGGLTETPQAAVFGNDATILGVILVPNGTLQMGQRNTVTGALVGRDVYVDMDSKLTFQSGLAVLNCAQFCNDGNPCTKDTCTGEVCSYPAAASGTSCSDGNPCNGAETCDGKGTCKAGTPITCTALDQCHAAGVCDPTTGTCSNPAKADGTSCNDANACTVSDICRGGTCSGTAYSCDDALACTTDACKGDGTCTHTLAANNCLIGGACYASGAANPTNSCQQCTPATSTSNWTSKSNGTACSDGNACTKNDVCTGGSCAGTAYSCNDGVACTTDVCNGDGTCSHPVVAGSCFINGACYASGAVNPGNQCQQCTPTTSQTAWSAKSNGTVCNDGSACTKNDVCTAGACGGTAYSCDDGLACTTDSCNGDGTCNHTIAAGNCAIAGACYAAAATSPTNQCQQCTPATSQTAWSAKSNGAACNDGNACTSNDKCTAGTCGGTLYSCDDGIACTTDSCKGDGTCTRTTTAGNCLIGGACYAAGVTSPINQCQQCTPATSQTGWSAKANGTACNDGNACTQTDTCVAGACAGSNPVQCTASDQCHDIGTCAQGTGACSNPAKPDGTACDDGKAESLGDACTGGVCQGTIPGVPVSDVRVGTTHSCAVHADGTLWCWGGNSYGQLGNGTTADSNVPIRAGATTWNWLSVAAGENHSCAIRSDGTLWCWGDNQSGQLGSEPADPTSTPRQVAGQGWTMVEAGRMYTCGVQTNKTLWCWGDNQHGGLGNGTQDNSTAPVEVVGTDWVSVAAGGWHTCGIKADHSLWCWGWNADGELGSGGTQDSATPVQIGGATWASVGAGASIDGEHTCAVKLDGSLWCWGVNAFGQLGVGSTTSSATPVQVGSATWTNVSGGAAHTCGVQGDGTLWCWGDNGSGQVGDGTLTNRLVPVQVPGQGWVQVAAGAGDTCGTRQDGSLWCWGENDRGQIGNGTDTPEMTPRQVAPHQYGQVPRCGDRNLDPGEECDDGNFDPNDGCAWDCKIEKCFNHAPCEAIDQCHVAGACDPTTGDCSNPQQPDETACDDKNACTQGETCESGVCQGGVTPTCTAIDLCHIVGVCDPNTGTCSNPAKDDVGTCDDGNPCTLDHCDPQVGCVHTPKSADGCSLSVQPKLTCVGARSNGTSFIAVFGYENSNGASINIPAGSDNSVSAPDEAIYPYVPEWFQPGTESAAMAVDFESGQEITWSLRGVSVTAKANSAPCRNVINGTVTLPDGKTFVTDPGQSYQSGYADSILPSEPSAAIRGTFAVTDDGAATYRLPLWVPPGLMGVQPQLALSYNSTGGDGFLGRGWQLQGMSQILRCRQDFARDNNRLSIQWVDSDRLCLDGQRLVLTKGTYNAAGSEYRTEHDRHLKIVQVGKDDFGPTGFVVYHPDGTRHSYGYDPAPTSDPNDFIGDSTAVLDGWAATISVNDGTTDEPTVHYDTQVRYGWALASSRDRYDNRVQYSYFQQYGSTDSTDLNRWTDFRPASIKYTFNKLRDADREIDFEYTSEDGTDARVDTRFSFVSGLQLRLGHLISKIKMYGKASGTSSLVKSYSMEYQQAARTSALLKTVKECDGSGICSQPTAFTWSTNDGTYQKRPTGQGAYQYQGKNPPGMLLTGDFNGDGRDDLAIGSYVTQGGTPSPPHQYYSSLASPSATELPFSGGGGYLATDVAALVDLNGDGTTDLIQGQPGLSVPYFCKAGTCNGSCPGPLGPPWTPPCGATLPYVGDFDGDGLVDLIAPFTPSSGGTAVWGYVPNNSKTGFANQYVTIYPSLSPTEGGNAYVNDYNGDGKAELIFWNAALMEGNIQSTFMHILADRTSGAVTTSLKASGKSLGSVRYQFADLNGDGLPDAIEIPNAGGDVRMAINTGRGFLPAKAANLSSYFMLGLSFASALPGEKRTIDPGIRIADVNLDGRADILYLGDGCRLGPGAVARTKISTLAADNDRYGSVSLVPADSPYNIGLGTYPGDPGGCYGFDGSQVLDANGDGLADFIQAEGDDYQLMLYQRQGPPPGLLTNVRDGRGATVDVTYAPMSDSTVYTRIECSYPQVCNQRGRWLVASHTFDKGTSTERPLTHAYKGARTDITGIGWLGMDQHTVTEVATATYGAIATVTKYDLDPNQNVEVNTYPKSGRPFEKTEIFDLRASPAAAHYLSRTSTFDQSFVYPVFADEAGHVWRRVVRDSDGVTTEETELQGGPAQGSNRVIRTSGESRTYDPDFGYVTTRTAYTKGEGDGNVFDQESWGLVYYDDDAENWLGGRLQKETAHSIVEGVEGLRVTSYERDLTTNALRSTTIEPDSSDPNLWKKTALTRNPLCQHE